VKLLDCPIAASVGQNKHESKRNVAKLAIFKVAPLLFEELFQGEDPPADFTDGTKKASFASMTSLGIEKTDETLTLGCRELAEKRGDSPIFEPYKPLQVLEYWAKHHGWLKPIPQSQPHA